MIRAEAQYLPVANSAIFGRMKPPEIRQRLRDSGRSQRALADYLGKSKDSISRLLNEDRRLTHDEAAQIKAFFGESDEGPSFLRVPVFGYAGAGGPDRVALASDHVLEHVEIPAGLARGEAFGVRIAGDSMYPRLFDGEIVIAERGLNPLRNREIVVELRDGTGLVKEYRGTKDGYLLLWQYNPEQELKIELTKVQAMHPAFRWR